MIHNLLIGHFDKSVRSTMPIVTRPIDIEIAKDVLSKYQNEDADNHAAFNEFEDDPLLADRFGVELGKIDFRPVIHKRGYLICPWLDGPQSDKFIRELQSALDVDLFEEGDCRFLSPPELDG